MNHRPILDAGPALNFLSIHQEKLLVATVGPLAAPEIVQAEVLRKAECDRRFAGAASVWRRMTPKWLEVLPDDQTPELAAVVQRISGLPMADRCRQSKDLGETMVIAHAVVTAEAGAAVTVLIDDGPGARIATAEIRRLDRRQAAGHAVGSISLVSTPGVLARAARKGHLPDKATMRRIYTQLRELDDGLMPIDRTELLSAAVWSSPG
jgi:hypothetical protein